MAWKKEEPEFVNTLPLFKVKRSQDYKAWCVVTCPREECGETFLVKLSAWFQKHVVGPNGTVITGRACPYCFKAGRLPARSSVR